eukprot:TRINITY_DN67332_c8_g4_i1.p1 TRINITY_DN67332_c8_g4~~TRINITY_DN67332_c8_g4_i1.p1  ORF type:complete len:548 (-),score=47.68 TRINITY_DN67332_c8_g4_i1:139-1782(-)
MWRRTLCRTLLPSWKTKTPFSYRTCRSVRYTSTTTTTRSTPIPPPPSPPEVPFPHELFSGHISKFFFSVTTACGVAYIIATTGKKGGFSLDTETKIEMTKPGSGAKFKDVAGCEEVVEELQDIVEFLTNIDKYNNMGAKLPKGVLLSGPPGTGKTMLAKAVANEANVPFFYMSGSEFEEVYVGLGAKRVRKLFKKARENSPCIVFVDEIDALGMSRKHTGVGYRGEQTLNEFLAEFDGFKSSSGVVVIGATNQPEVLDSALTRAGRFDKKVVVGLPDIKGRKEILNTYLSKLPHLCTSESPIEDIASLVAKGTAGMSGADLKNLVNEAAIKATLEDAKEVTLKHLDFAKDKVQMGTPTTSRIIPDEEKNITAYHESGHALVALFAEAPLPIHKLTIVPHSKVLGFLQYQDTDDKSITKKELGTRLATAMGGRVAEELTFGEENVTTGASNDFENATKLATDMVTRYGFNNGIGPVDCSDRRIISDKTQAEIDTEVKKLIDGAYKEATSILKKQSKKLEKLSQELKEKETLSAAEVLDLLGLPKQKNT